MRADARKFISLLTPVLLHQVITLAAALLLGVCADQYGLEYNAALDVLVGNLLVIPVAGWMYRGDRRSAASPLELESGTKPAAESVSVRRNTEPEKIPASGEAGRAERKNAQRGEGCCAGQSSETFASGRKWQRRQLMFGIFCFAAGGVLNIAWSGILNLLQIQAHFSNQVQEQLLSANLIVQVIGLGIVAPVTEELIFRGLTYRRMRQLFPAWAAVFLSALLFAVYHGNPIQMLFSFPMAVVLALVYEHGKLFLFPVLFHMGSNLTAIFLQILL